MTYSGRACDCDGLVVVLSHEVFISGRNVLGLIVRQSCY